jgi:hypothetical protein
VNQPTEEISALNMRDHAERCDRRSALGSQELQSSMRARLGVVLDVGPQDSVEVSGAENQLPVQALCANSLHPAFGEGVGVRRPDWCADHADPFAREDIIEGAREFRVAVADEKAGARALVRETYRHVARLLGDEERVRTARLTADAHAPIANLDEEQHVERPQKRGLDREEVAGDDA